MFELRSLTAYLLITLTLVSCQSSPHSNSNDKTPVQVAAEKNRTSVIVAAQGRDAESRYAQDQDTKHLSWALTQYGYAAEEDPQYLTEVFRVVEILRAQDKGRLHSFEVVEALVGLYQVHPNNQALRRLLDEVYRPYIDENRAWLKIESHLRYRPRDILQREPGQKGLKHIRELYCADERYSLALNMMEKVAKATGRTEDQKLWNLQWGDLSMTRVPCPVGVNLYDRTGVFYDPEDAYEAYKETEYKAETKHAAQLAAYTRLQDFFVGHHRHNDEDRFGEWVFLLKEDLDRAKALFSAAGWDEARTKRAIVETGKFWAKAASEQNDTAIRKWLDKNT